MTNIRSNRRELLRATAGLAGAPLLGVLGISPALAAEMGKANKRARDMAASSTLTAQRNSMPMTDRTMSKSRLTRLRISSGNIRFLTRSSTLRITAPAG